jgi:hypothetical protein
LFYGLAGTLMLSNAVAVCAIFMAPDIARIVDGHSDRMISAYEERITQLRIEVDRLHSRSFAQAGDINLQLQDLAQQQETLAEQHNLVRVLVDRASDLGIESAALPTDDLAITVSSLYSPATGNPDIAATAASLDLMMVETRAAMTSISEVAADKTDTIVAELEQLGLPADLPDGTLIGMGGPLLPPVDDAAAADMVTDANGVLAALIRYQAARDLIETAPVHMPIAGQFRQSSVFGNRRDPFSGSRAFHAGLDFAAPTGTLILSAGGGRVSFAGTRSGYGKTVEITHDSGLVTRYAHMSAILATAGQEIAPGTPIGKVGSTGRSTGPHLHFEVRKADGPIDPKQFIDAGKRLQQII